MIYRVILIRNAVETLGFFSEQIALELERCGYEIYFVDYDALYDTICGLHRFAVKGQTALVTFNFIGIGGEEIFRDETGGTVWEKYDVQCLNILVDHPFYFHAKLKAAYRKYSVWTGSMRPASGDSIPECRYSSCRLPGIWKSAVLIREAACEKVCAGKSRAVCREHF